MSNKLTEIANEARKSLLVLNEYQDVNGKRYNVAHPNATQEVGENDPFNIRGKGTGVELGTLEGGSSIDINGRSDVSNSGRKGHFQLNLYNRNNEYKTPEIDPIF